LSQRRYVYTLEHGSRGADGHRYRPTMSAGLQQVRTKGGTAESSLRP